MCGCSTIVKDEKRRKEKKRKGKKEKEKKRRRNWDIKKKNSSFFPLEGALAFDEPRKDSWVHAVLQQICCVCFQCGCSPECLPRLFSPRVPVTLSYTQHWTPSPAPSRVWVRSSRLSTCPTVTSTATTRPSRWDF